MAFYRIQSGDTLGAIAARNGVSVQDLVAANPHITNPDLIYAGDMLIVPDGTQAGSQPAASPQPFVPDWISQAPPQVQQAFGYAGGGVPAQPGSVGGGVVNPTATVGTPSGGTITVQVEREDGSVITQPVFIPGATWDVLRNNPEFSARWGLWNNEPFIPVGGLERFKKDMAEAGIPQPVIDLVNERLSFLPGGANQGSGVTDVSKQPPPPGFAWSVDPATGEKRLVDLEPLTGPKLSSWHYVITNPETGEGNWQLVADPNDMNAVYEGVPDSVRPWVQYALNQGGSTDGIPNEAKAWVEFVLGQAANSSRRPPGELPFGIGLPNFTPSAGGLSQPPGWGGTTTGGSGGGTPGGGGGTGVINQIFAGSRWAPVDDDSPGSVGEGQFSRTGFEGTYRTLTTGGSVGTSMSAINADTPSGHFFRSLLDQGLIDVVPIRDIVGQSTLDAHAGMNSPIDADAVQIRYKGPTQLDDTTPGVSALPPAVPRDPEYAAPPSAPTPPSGIDSNLRATYENMLNTSYLDPGTRAAIERELGR